MVQRMRFISVCGYPWRDIPPSHVCICRCSHQSTDLSLVPSFQTQHQEVNDTGKAYCSHTNSLEQRDRSSCPTVGIETSIDYCYASCCCSEDSLSTLLMAVALAISQLYRRTV